MKNKKYVLVEMFISYEDNEFEILKTKLFNNFENSEKELQKDMNNIIEELNNEKVPLLDKRREGNVYRLLTDWHTEYKFEIREEDFQD